MVLIAVLIKIDSRGPVFIVQERVGLNGKIFKCYKFRTMVENAESNGAKLSDAHDVRVTRAGAFLRVCFLDELPQLFNIFVGEMSFVGPRPERPYFHKKFSRKIAGWAARVYVKPGLAGLAQVHGFSSLEPEKKLEKDLEYIRNQGFFVDMKLIAVQLKIALENTVLFVVK